MQALRARASSKYITNYIHHLSTTMQCFYVIKIKYPFFLNPIQPVKISNIMASRSNIFRAGDLLFLDNDMFFFLHVISQLKFYTISKVMIFHSAFCFNAYSLLGHDLYCNYSSCGEPLQMFQVSLNPTLF